MKTFAIIILGLAVIRTWVKFGIAVKLEKDELANFLVGLSTSVAYLYVFDYLLK